MNARTLRKRLMRRPAHRAGRRAYLTISVPLSMYPEVPPLFDSPGLPADFEGHWRSEDGRTQWSISKVSSGRKPEDPGAVDLRQSRWGDSWEWYEGREFVLDGEEVVERRPLPEATIRTYAHCQRWADKWLYGRESFAEDELSEPVARLFLCADWAKSVHARIDGERVLFTWGVKWLYPHRKLRFCRDAVRSLEAVRRAGLDVRVRR